jgi:predicted mannosyl-3-phosphoglycerate phosphatase (HAD superfamily)
MRCSDEKSENESEKHKSPRAKKWVYNYNKKQENSFYSVYDQLKEKQNEIKDLEDKLNEQCRLRQFQNEESILKITQLKVWNWNLFFMCILK